jgi:pimeloyl-ACP methyl ester carboxylesterase
MIKRVRHNDWELVYQSSGDGELWLAFHGYGQNKDFLTFIPEQLKAEATFFLFDLFVHGESKAVPKRAITKTELKAIFEALFESEQIKRINLFGYSLGGKLALCLLELFPEKTDKIFLVAPDGIKRDYPNFLLNRTYLGDKILHLLHRNPALISSSLKVLKGGRIINEKAYHYYHSQTTDSHKREFVLKVWKVFSKLNPNLKEIKRILSERPELNFNLVYGKFDSLISARHIEKFSNDLIELRNAQFRKLDSGHNLLNADLIPLMKSMLPSGAKNQP